jgi:hypothetical protein
MTKQANVDVEGTVASLFQPDALLASQYLELHRTRTQLRPEKRLMFAVLEDAIACFQDYLLARDERGKSLFRDAEEWIMKKNNDWLFSFENICEVLGLNPKYVRQGLLRWREAKLAKCQKAKMIKLTPQRKNNCGEPAGKAAPKPVGAAG